MKNSLPKPSGLQLKTKEKISLLILLVLCYCTISLVSLLIPEAVENSDNRFQDVLFRTRYSIQGKEDISPYIQPVVLDDHELIAMSGRSALGLFYQLSSYLVEAGAGAVGIDRVFFTERGGDFYSTSFPQNNDQVIHSIFPFIEENFASLEQPGRSKTFEPYIWYPPVVKEGDPLKAESLFLPNKELLESAGGMGHILTYPDRDGGHRRYPMVIKYKEGYIPSLSLVLVCRFLDVSPRNIKISFGDYIMLNNARVPGGTRIDMYIPIDNKGRMIINWPGPWDDSFQQNSFSALYQAAQTEGGWMQMRELMRDTLVLISDITSVSKDFGTGIWKEHYPSNGIHLSVMNTILTGRFVHDASFIEVLLVTLICWGLLWFFGIAFDMKIVVISAVGLYFIRLGFVYFRFLNDQVISQITLFTINYIIAFITVLLFRFILLNNHMHELNHQRELEKQELLHANKLIALGTLASSIAHEVANPNSAISSNTHFITQTLPHIKDILLRLHEESGVERINRIPVPLFCEKLDQGVESIARSSSRIEKIVKEVRNFYKGASRQGNTIKPVDINKVVESSLFLMGHQLRKGKISLKTEYSKTVSCINGDFQRLEQVLINLLINACQAVDSKKEQIRDPEYNGAITITTTRIDEDIKIIIEDNGTGIDSEHIESIIKPFYSTKLDSGGTGLGLHICDKIIKDHKGTLSFTSEMGLWTQVVITFPLKENGLLKDSNVKTVV